ncbi:MAG: MotA/TolQ/ExbB proton channel family protein [Lentisphaerae bacterium]|jgi:biopolymer transport protein ExbB|nr:MotA/TolQ/ExbB proton channel family protein [Lentisphaerota bacterium]
MSKKSLWAFLVVAVAIMVVLPAVGWAQDVEMEGTVTDSEVGMGLWAIIAGSGLLGIILWSALGLCSIAAAWLAIDFFITVNPKKIISDDLVNDVREAMEQGDVMKAMQRCEEDHGVLSAILLAGFRNVKEGFEVIQEQVAAAADLESEKLMQRVSYLNMCGSIAPMLGLLGTVQGMIAAFANLATSQAGAAQQSLLALNIAQALWTTAAGLVVAIPAVSFYTYFKNRLSRIILNMEGLTIDLIKALRNVEVIEE